MQENNYSVEKIIKNDKLPFEADPAIEQRLMYHFQIRAGKHKIRRSSFLPFIDGVFSTRFAGLKIGFATLFIVMAIGFKQFNAPENIQLQADTISTIPEHDTLSCIIGNKVLKLELEKMKNF